MVIDEPSVDAESRAAGFAQHANLAWVAEVLAERRDSILSDWLVSARAQPFHLGNAERAVSDHIPDLFDGILAVLQRSAPRWLEPSPVFEDPAVVRAAREHARARFSQGLEPADIVTEFRLLRQDIGRALRACLADAAPISDILGAELLVHDALDGAITVALVALSRHVEELRQDFLATTLHDVQQPLSTIKGRVQLAMRQLKRPDSGVEPAATGLQKVADEVDRLTCMLGGLADASRLALGEFQLRPSEVDLTQLVREAICRLPTESAARMHLFSSSGAVTGEWDRELLERVLDNILSNAMKYSPPGTPIEISLESTSGTAQFALHDHGIGLSPDELEQVFERYQRAAAAVKGGLRGQGLGLYLARGVVEAHGGRIWLVSRGTGLGTTVFVRLPCHAHSKETTRTEL